MDQYKNHHRTLLIVLLRPSSVAIFCKKDVYIVLRGAVRLLRAVCQLLFLLKFLHFSGESAQRKTAIPVLTDI